MAHVNPSLVAETGTLSSGVVTVSGAVTSPGAYRTFAAALTDGDTVDVVVRDAQGDQASYLAATWDETAGTLTLGTADVTTGTITDGTVTVWAASDRPPTPSGTLSDLTSLKLDNTVRTYTNSGADVLSATAQAGGALIVYITGGAGTITSSSITWLGGSSVDDINHASGVVELALRSDGTTVFASAMEPTP